jgi:hypothetical protein
MFVRKSLRQVVLAFAASALVLAACGGGAAPEPTVDVNAINTAAVETAMGQLSAQFTQTALAAPTITSVPTNTALPLPTFALPTAGAGSPAPTGALPTVSFNSTATTPLAGFTALASPVAPAGTTSLGDSCNNSAFEGDVTIPDGSVLEPGHNFIKTWKIRNSGTCTWDEGYALVYIGGSDPDLDPYNFQFENANDFVSGGEAVDISLDLTTPCEPGEYEGHWRMRNDQGFYFGTVVSVYVEVQDDC